MPWSIAIKKRQLNWFGHMTRLPYNTPEKLALNHALKPTIRPTILAINGQMSKIAQK